MHPTTDQNLAPALAGGVAVTGRMLELDSARDGPRIDREGFSFSHHLAGLPIFDMDHLLELARITAEQRPADLYYDAGRIAADARWNDMAKPAFSVTDALRRIESAEAWIILRRADLHPAYAPILDRCMQDVLQAGGSALAQRTKRREVIIFITSPHRVTAYHMDRECSFLMQVHGAKTLSLFDPTDREVLPETEIERFWARDNNAIVYRKHLQDRAREVPLAPGVGVHIPINAPHWVQNGPDISVSININFVPPDSERGNIYRANYHLRQLGLHPRPPFQSPLADAVKRPLGAAATGARAAVRKFRTAMRPAGA